MMSMEQILSIMLFIITGIDINLSQRREGTFSSLFNQRYYGETLEIMSVSSMSECVVSCTVNENCNIVNIGPEEHTERGCILIEIVTDASQLEYDPGWRIQCK